MMKLVPAIQKIKHLERMYNMDERDLWDEIYDLISDSSKEICVIFFTGRKRNLFYII